MLDDNFTEDQKSILVECLLSTDAFDKYMVTHPEIAMISLDKSRTDKILGISEVE